MAIDLFLLKREMHRSRLSMRELFRRAKLSKTERLCVLNGLRVDSYVLVRICEVLDCRQDALFAELAFIDVQAQRIG